MSDSTELKKFLQLTSADGIIIFNSKGELLESENINKGKNFAAMAGVLMTMASELSEDVSIGNLKQFMFKGDNGLFVIEKIEDDFIIGVYCKDLAKAGLIVLSMDKLVKSKIV